MNEVWDYSRSNVHHRCNHEGVVYRYIPPGYIPTIPKVLHRDSVRVQVERGRTQHDMVSFLSGNPPRCSDKLQNKWLKEQQRGVNAWNSAEFSDLLKHHTVFGTVHKECQKEHPNNEVASVEAFRVATLMSAGGNVVVSEPAFKGDMADFEGHGVRHITWYTS